VREALTAAPAPKGTDAKPPAKGEAKVGEADILANPSPEQHNPPGNIQKQLLRTSSPTITRFALMVAATARIWHLEPMKPRFPIGIDDFAKIRREGLIYVDRTPFVQEVVESSSEVLLFPRPRRFGKSLNLSTLRYFFEKSDEEQDRRNLFQGLAIEQAGEEVWRHFGRYPVIYLSFKDIKKKTWEDCLAGVAQMVAREVRRLERFFGSVISADGDRTALKSLLSINPKASILEDALAYLSQWLHQATGERVVILIDEYDMPLHTAFTYGYYEEAVTFFRNFLSAGLKGNIHLHKGIITGVLRIARESLFSGLNNLVVHNLLSPYFATAFGFTEKEVESLAKDAGQIERMDDLRQWYNGYIFGGEVIYNPWSIINALAYPAQNCQPYWVNTSSDDMLRDLLVKDSAAIHADIEKLLVGESVVQPVQENLVLRDLKRKPGAVWSLLLFSGYLTATGPISSRRGRREYALRIPNREVQELYETIFSDWLQESLGSTADVEALGRAILEGDALTFEALLSRFLEINLSYHDTATPQRTPERIYQAFVVGLLVWMEPDYLVRSNPESGFGRADVLITPKEPGKPGAVLELKSFDPRRDTSVEHALENALEQIRRKDYAAQVRAHGADPVHIFACVFKGKEVWVKLGVAS